MCGIVGYAGGRGAAEIIYNGLVQLEYRGYDSAGIAILDGDKISVVKRRGRVGILSDYVGNMRGSTGIGHTRWATHGEPSDENAHPHTAGKFAIVHNGIIENYSELKRRYFDGEKFNSQTDSEVIVRLLDKFYDGDIAGTLNTVCGLLKGSYALAVICTDFDGIAVAKRNNPAILGYGQGENYVASDAPAIAFCKEISVLEDGDIALIARDGVSIFDADMRRITRARLPNPATPASLDLGGYPHYMFKEINEVPASVERTLAAYSFAEDKVKAILDGAKRIIITGCGTAYNSGLVAKIYIEDMARIPAEVETAGEFRYKTPIITADTVVIAISQSGETADTLEAAKLAVSLGAKLIAVTNAPYSALTGIADAVVPVAAGSEICVAATKSYTGQIAALYLIANTLAGVSSAEAGKRLAVMPGLLECTLKDIDIYSVADMCARSGGVYFLGRGIDYAVAVEGSLKLKEVSYVHSEGYPSGELKHGTLALIDNKAVAVVIITDEMLADKSANAVEQVLSRQGEVAVISNVAGIENKFPERVKVVKIPPCDKYFSPLLSAIAVQLLAYTAAVKLNRDPDKPRNLAKSVTVE